MHKLIAKGFVGNSARNIVVSAQRYAIAHTRTTIVLAANKIRPIDIANAA
jgi:hypothetical protein